MDKEMILKNITLRGKVKSMMMMMAVNEESKRIGTECFIDVRKTTSDETIITSLCCGIFGWGFKEFAKNYLNLIKLRNPQAAGLVFIADDFESGLDNKVLEVHPSVIEGLKLED